MNKYLACTSLCVLSLGFAGGAFAQDLSTRTLSASVSGVVAPSGFSQTASVGVAGFGSGAVSVNTETANFRVLGAAAAGQNDEDAFAGSGVASDFTLNRTVQVSGSGIGVGQVFATGTSLGTLGFEGLAGAKAEVGTIDNAAADPELTSNSASSSSGAAIDGRAGTTLGLEMIGATSGFVGALATENTTTDQVAAVGANFVTSASESIVIAPFEGFNLGTSPSATAPGVIAGSDSIGIAGFNSQQTAGGLDLAVANLGGGTMEIGGQVTGFFGGGFGTGATSNFGNITSAP